MFCEIDNISTTPSTTEDLGGDGSDTTSTMQNHHNHHQGGLTNNQHQKIKWKNLLSPSTSSSSPLCNDR